MENSLQQLGYSTQAIRFWRTLQRRFYQLEFYVIDFIPEEQEPKHWQIIFGQSDTKTIKAVNWGKGTAAGIKMNQYLRRYIVELDYIPNKSFWKSMEQSLRISGCLVPITELSRLEETQLEKNLDFLHLQQLYFPFTSYLAALKNSMLEKAHYSVPIAVKALWLHFQYTVNFIRHLRKEEPVALAKAHAILDEKIAIADFDNYLPSRQLQLMLYRHLYDFHLKGKAGHLFAQMQERAVDAVQAYFNKYQDWLTDFYDKGFGDGPNYLPAETEQQIQVGFYELCQLDEALIRIQEIIDDASGLYFAKFLTPHFRDRFDPRMHKKSLRKRLQQSIGDRSIMDRIQSVADQLKWRKQPYFGPTPYPLFAPKVVKWHQLKATERAELLEAIESFPPTELKRLRSTVITRWSYQLRNRLNAVSTPFLVWENESGLVYPQWNFFASPRLGQLQNDFLERRAREEKELQQLEDLLNELASKQSMLMIRQLKENAQEFTLEEIIERWRNAIHARELTVQNQMNYRIRRMREFSILEGDAHVTHQREIWLDEILEIEEEVKPFILFVKKAFQAALPIRRAVEFDPYRHSHDGVEFDPMTVQDQDKWMRANVMRTLRRRVDRGDVVQVNAFALDSSGSMDHDRMRNLFKILYLLVLGLEDRKSFDAFHFFSTYFNETANFTNLYTNRKLLFKVLRRIATISNWQVKYGGGGGTNISEAVDKCHARIIEFVKAIKEEDPEANVACSLFVITDGEPTVGITDLPELAQFIEDKRKIGDVAIKGIYIKEKAEEPDFMSHVFGEQHYVETLDFSEAVNKFVTIMTRTYKEQRRAFKWKKKKKSKSKL